MNEITPKGYFNCLISDYWLIGTLLISTPPMQVLVMHGGLFANDGVTLADIHSTERNRQPPESGIMCDLLWSDPQPQAGRAPSKRGVGIAFGPDVTQRFCEENDLLFIVRSHEVKVCLFATSSYFTF